MVIRFFDQLPNSEPYYLKFLFKAQVNRLLDNESYARVQHTYTQGHIYQFFEKNTVVCNRIFHTNNLKLLKLK